MSNIMRVKQVQNYSLYIDADIAIYLGLRQFNFLCIAFLIWYRRP
jgi:hypothetical protein